jgi:hypothetical protein
MIDVILDRSGKQLFNFGYVCGSGSAATADNGGTGLQPVDNISGITRGIKI